MRLDLYTPVLMPPNHKDFDRLADATAAQIKHEARLKSESLWRCHQCKKLSKIGDTEYIQTHRYVAPYSCTGGDYWKQGEGRAVCPECNHVNRLYESSHIEAIKGSFRSVKDTHDD